MGAKATRALLHPALSEEQAPAWGQHTACLGKPANAVTPVVHRAHRPDHRGRSLGQRHGLGATGQERDPGHASDRSDGPGDSQLPGARVNACGSLGPVRARSATVPADEPRPSVTATKLADQGHERTGEQPRQPPTPSHRDTDVALPSAVPVGLLCGRVMRLLRKNCMVHNAEYEFVKSRSSPIRKARIRTGSGTQMCQGTAGL